MAQTSRTRQTNSRQSRRRGRPTQHDVTSSRPPDHTGLLISAILLMIVGWGGLYFVITQLQPRIGGELWLFFACLLLAITGTAIPFVRYVNVIFTPVDSEVPPSGVIVRQSIWLGLFVLICIWLQIPRALSLPLAFFIAMVFVVVEVFLRTREIAALRDE